MIKVLIVDDDPMVAEFNKRYLAELPGFILGGIVHNVADGLEFIKNTEVDLVLLDVYMPGRQGLELLKFIRENSLEVDVILITAASDSEKVQSALRLGAVDYLIKPFEFERFQQALLNYKEKFLFFGKNKRIKQEELDQKILAAEQRSSEGQERDLPKGLTRTTLQVLFKVVKELGGSTFSTDEVADKADISRVSVRKYLKFLTEIGVLEESLTYGIGRPVSLYVYQEQNSHLLNPYM
jgi:two-component system, CitB family, response regulator MalR